MPPKNRIQLRRGTTQQWGETTDILATGEVGFDSDVYNLKIGDGKTGWANLPWLVDISGQIVSVTGEFDVLKFNTNPGVIPTEGQAVWNNTYGTLSIGLAADHVLNLGQETHFRIRNETGDTLYKGQAVYATGVHNDNIRIEADKYVADGTIREVRFIGLVSEDVTDNSSGFTTNFGYVRGNTISVLDTRGNGSVNGAQNLYTSDEPIWEEGNILYVHPTVPGKLTKIEPKHSIIVAMVVRVHQNEGVLLVRPTSYGHLDDNHDVSTSGVEHNQYLIYNSGTDLWTPTSSGIFTKIAAGSDGAFPSSPGGCSIYSQGGIFSSGVGIFGDYSANNYVTIGNLSTDVGVFDNEDTPIAIKTANGLSFLYGNIYYDLVTDNVGVGKSDPGSKLEVNGIITAKDSLKINSEYQPYNYFPAVHAEIQCDQPLDYGGLDSYPRAISIQNDNTIIIGGSFLQYNFTDVKFLSKLNSSGILDTNFGLLQGTGFNASIYSVRIQNDGKIIVGGSFTKFGENDVNRITRLNADGSLDNNFSTTGTGFNNIVRSVALQNDGKIIVGGSFTNYNGTAVDGIARLNTDGTLDSTFNVSGATFNGDVLCLGIQSNNKIIVGGNFTTFNNTTKNRILRLNSDGSLDTSFAGSGLNNIPYVIFIQSDDQIIVGGSFTIYNGFSQNRIVRIDSANGSIDSTFGFNLGTGFNSTVYAINMQSDGKIIVGGSFTLCNGENKNRIARLNNNGTLDSSFNTGAGFDTFVHSIGIQSDNKIIVGGDFTKYNNVNRYKLLRLNANGNLDTTEFANTGNINGGESGFINIKVPSLGNPVSAMKIFDGGVSVGNNPPLPNTQTLSVYGNLELFPFTTSANQIPGTDGGNIRTSGYASFGGVSISGLDLNINNNNIIVNKGIIEVNNSFNNPFNMTINSSGISITKKIDVDYFTDYICAARLEPNHFGASVDQNSSDVKILFGGVELQVDDTVLFTGYTDKIYNGIYKVAPSTQTIGQIKFIRDPLYSTFISGQLFGIILDGSIYKLNPVLSPGQVLTVGTDNISFLRYVGESIVTFNEDKDAEFAAKVYAKEKYFRIQHPDPESSYEYLQYGSLESPYHGVRLTGEGELKNGTCTIKLPTYLKHLIHEKDINIQLTNKGHHKILYLDKIDLKNDKFIVKGYRSKTGGPFAFFWCFTGVRKDVDPLIPEY